MNVTLACSDEVPDDACRVNDTIFDGCNRGSGKFSISVNFGGDSQSLPPIIFKAVASSTVSAISLLVPTKFYIAYLELCGTSDATITIVEKLPSPEKPDSIELHFLRRVDFLQWYEADSFSKASSKWPKQLSPTFVEKCLPQLLYQSHLRLDRVISVSIFGQLYFFEVNTANAHDSGHFIPDLQTKYHIIIPNNDDLSTSSTLQYQDNLSYLQPSLTDAMTSISHFLSTDLRPLAFTSTLYSAPQGSGKTTFFQILQKHVLSHCKYAQVIYLDVAAFSSSLSAWPFHSDMSIEEILSIFIKLSSNNTSTEAKDHSYDSIIIFIDHLDVVFTSFISDLQDSNNTSASTAAVENFGYLLHNLLNLIKQTPNNKVMVLGACRMNQMQLPRGSSGCPDFERVIVMPKPDEHDRLLLLQYLFNKHKIQDEDSVFSSKLADLTRGYLPSDLARLVNHAVSISASSDLTWEVIINAMSSSVCAPQALLDLQQLQHNRSSTSSSDASSYSWDSFLGYNQVKHDLLRITHRLTTSSKSYLLLAHSQPSRGMVLYGPSGCGKTHICQILAHQMIMNLVTIQCTDLLSKYFGETEAKMRNVFAAARAAAPCMLVFDNFEALAHRRGLDTASGASNPFASNSGESGNEEIGNRILSTFLNEIDGIAAASTMFLEQSIFVVAACSDVKMLDEALVRPGRLQHHIHLDYPSLDEILAILHHQLLNTALEPSINLQQLAQRIMVSKGMFSKVSSGQVIDICTSAKMTALEEAVEKYQLRDRSTSAKYVEEGKVFDEEMVRDRHFQKVLAPVVVASIPFKLFL